MQVGDNVYIILNNQKVQEVTILKMHKDSCLIAMGEYSGFWIWKSRLYSTRKEAEQLVPKKMDLKYNAVANGL